jgi:hypothetical protein
MIEKVWDDSWSFQSFQSYFYKWTNMRIFQHEGFTLIRSEFYENSYELPTLPRLPYLTDDRLDIVTAKEFHVLKYL